MKYEGINKEGFDRDARCLNEWIEFGAPSHDEIANAAHDLADAFEIDTRTSGTICQSMSRRPPARYHPEGVRQTTAGL